MLTREDAIECYERACLASAWQVAGRLGCGGGNILDVANEVAKAIGPDADGCHVDDDDVRDAIIDALSTHATEEHGERGDRCGCTRIGGCHVWWVENNAYTEWHCDQPAWWDEQVAQYQRDA